MLLNFYFFVSVMSVSVSLPTVTVQYVIFLVIDAFRLLILAQLTGLARVKTKEFHAPEDARGKDYTPVGQDTSSMSLAARAMRAHYNAIENDLVWLFATTALMYSQANVNAIIAFNTFYQFFRICHAIFYMLGKQPFRALSFLGGAICCIIMLCYAFVQVIINS
uniref:Microsomal glutathione S-transferase 1 n=1 Tax=Vannella robusta TaxID=1487602 RepID=A0A7S4HZ06_9EUKA|mmetsp:Transcript_17839/g.22673  ORF Transcript_17839/g.22673 Transcript_17839/m.22673 type:complete len:164 (+) Transcript_17839:54-545(+)